MSKVDLQVDPSLLKELVVGNKIFRSAIDCNLTEKDLEKARKELNETAEKRRTCLEKLKVMLSEDTRMRYRMDDDYLLRFLRYQKYNIQKAYKSIEYFYSMRNKDPQLFGLSPDVELKMKGKIFNVMPYTYYNGEMIFLHRLGYWNPPEISVRDFCAIFSSVSDVLSSNPHAQIDGVIDIFDFEGISAGLIPAVLHPPNLRLFTKMAQDVYPWRVKKVVLFNCSALLYASIYVIRCFLKKKITDRIVLIRSDFEELHMHVNPAFLPKEYGGNLDDEECYSYLKKVVSSNREYLRYENSFIGYNE